MSPRYLDNLNASARNACHVWHVLAVVIAIAMLAAPARSQGGGAGADRGHIWLLLPGDEPGETVLVHAPPRRADGDDSYRASDPGALRVARRLSFGPVGLCAGEDRVTLVARARPAADGSADPVRGPRALTLSAVPTPLSDFWAYEPHGRFLPEPPLPDALDVRSVSSLDGAPVVLGYLEGRWWLGALGPDAWDPIPIPIGASHAADLVLTGSTGAGLGLVAPGEKAPWRVWERGEAIGEDDPGWTAGTLSARRPLGEGAVYRVGRRWIATRHTAAGIEVSTLDNEDERLLARIDRASTDAVVGVTGDAGGRLIAVWTIHAHDDRGSGEVEIAEVSLVTGDVLYRGEPVRISPITATQFRLLAAALVGMAVLALLIVLGPGETPIVLPEGASLAEPGRRFIATVADLAVAAGVVSLVFRVPVLDLLSLRVLFAGDGSWVAVPATLGAAVVVCTLLEWLVGCTLGKALTGCRVASVRAADAQTSRGPDAPPARPHLWQALVRNLIKWGLPPVAALALLDPSGRHRGEVLSRTAVVVPTPAEAPSE